MAGDIKTLIAEFKAMNGKLIRTTVDFEEHNDDSKLFRHKVDTIWAVIHTLKWVSMTLFGSGLLVQAILKYIEMRKL